MSSTVVAIGLDALPPGLLEQWVADSQLPFLAHMFAEGGYARQKNSSLYRTENSWLTLLQGCAAEDSEEWGHQTYRQGQYQLQENAAYAFKRYKPFYALGKQRRVAVFDIPLTGLVDNVNGVQLLGWGTEVNQVLRQSFPPGMMDDLIRRHGRHPLYASLHLTDDGSETLSYRIPCVYDLEALRSVRDDLIRAVHQRTAILRELLALEKWDLFFCAYAEIHTAGHLFWHLGRDHPISEPYREAAGSDFMLDVMKAIDSDLALIFDALLPDAEFLLFSPHGMQANSLDLNLTLMLPELLYRWNTGEAAFKGHDEGCAPPPPGLGFSRHWSEEVRELLTDHGKAVLEPPDLGADAIDPLDWDPSHWFQPLWPRMKAFKLPGYSEGLVRINVIGRDGTEGIKPDQFGTTCEELTELFGQMRDARTGIPVVRETIRVREQPFDGAEGQSPADLIVVWNDEICTDVVEHPRLGRIGPVPFFRPGGHSTEGFLLARASGFEPGRQLVEAETADMTATILDLLGEPIPRHVSGRPLNKVLA